MRMRRLVLPLAACAVLAPAGSAAARETSSQAFFRKALVADAKTSSAVKRALRSGAAFVDPRPAFADITGDGRSDAVVPVVTGGAAGAIAIYVFSTDGISGTPERPATLRVVYRNQRLYRAVAVVREGPVLVLRVPRYAPGDALCCPAKIAERTYVWDRRARTMRLRSSRDVDGPREPAPAMPQAAPEQPAAG